MNRPELVNVCDCTLPEAENHFQLSFKEKIELCRLIDKLGVSSIDLSPIRQKKIDRLLVKSICSAVKNASVAVPVSITDDESVRITWEALKEAVNPRLQVVVPVSSVQMEYLLHMKTEAMIRTVTKAVTACRELTANVEFIAQDATRSDPAFLVKVLSAAIEAGAGVVTLCDTAGTMMPDEIAAWLENLKKDLPALENVTMGFFCSGELNMADANAVSAIRSGVREIKATTCSGAAISLPNIVRLLNIKGGSLGVCTKVGVEQIRRITGQVGMICQSSGKKHDIISGFEEENKDSDYVLSIHDSIESVMHADDQQKVWKCFCQTAEKKDHITLRELEAIIAAEAMQVPPAYHDVLYTISTGNQIGAMAHMKLKFHDQEIEGISSGDGAIQSVTRGREAMGETIVRLRWEGKLYSGRGISTDIVGAGIMAYINAVNKIVYEEEEA